MDRVASEPPSAAVAPAWLAQRLQAGGGGVPFRSYMEWVLHDPDHGAYGAGRLRIGPGGDFTTAPSLGSDFAALLAPQIAQWLAELGDGPLALVEAGPGEGSLAADLAGELARHWPELAARTELVLLEPNPGMARRQRERLLDAPLPCRWSGFGELASSPLRGVLLAHEVLDALAVERIVVEAGEWRRQWVRLTPAGELQLVAGDALEPAWRVHLGRLGLLPPSGARPDGWSTELHPGLAPWLQQAASALCEGRLLVIDYALSAARYYQPARSSGTLLAYRGQMASADPLREPGAWDLTAHLCLESLEAAALQAGWQALGGCRQGEALLALGLAQRLHGLQAGAPTDLPLLLRRREALLRLVDPQALGEFQWQAFRRGDGDAAVPLFLREPQL
jgi:SAM-dependent MidA family methyltransferase